MSRIAWWAILAGVLGSLPMAPATAQERMPARVRAATRGPYYVAQEIALDVTVVAGGTRPALRLPDVPGASLAVAGQGMRPISTSAIGDVVSETIQWSWRVRVVPGRAGVLVVPPLAVASGGRTGKTAALSLEVRTPPAAGRPSAFLGGVGPLVARLEVRPAAVRVGEPVEVRLTLDGPGARGSTRPLADLIGRLERLAIAPEVRELPPEATDDPPGRVRRLRLRPTRPGAVTLPPVIVSWFDPATAIYQGALASAVSLRVVEVPPLDPAAFRLPPGEAPGGVRRISPWWARGVGLAGLLLAAALVVRARLRRRTPGPRREALRLAVQLRAGIEADDGDAARAAGAVAVAMAEYLQIATGRVPGALTPREAADGVLAATADAALGFAAGALLDRCDRSRYDDRAIPEETASGLRRDAAALLERVAATHPRWRRRGGDATGSPAATAPR
jgi:hypothetical protein